MFFLDGIGNLGGLTEKIKVLANFSGAGISSAAEGSATKGIVVEGIVGVVKVIAKPIVGIFKFKGIATIVMMGIISAWVPFLGREIEARWFSWPNILILAPVPLLTAFVAYRIYRNLEDGYTTAPFLLSIVLFLLGFLGLVINRCNF